MICSLNNLDIERIDLEVYYDWYTRVRSIIQEVDLDWLNYFIHPWVFQRKSMIEERKHVQDIYTITRIQV